MLISADGHKGWESLSHSVFCGFRYPLPYPEGEQGEVRSISNCLKYIHQNCMASLMSPLYPRLFVAWDLPMVPPLSCREFCSHLKRTCIVGREMCREHTQHCVNVDSHKENSAPAHRAGRGESLRVMLPNSGAGFGESPQT